MPGAGAQSREQSGAVGSAGPVSGGAGAASRGGAGSSGGTSAPAPSAKKKSGGGFLGSLVQGLGSVFHVVEKAPSALGTLATGVAKEAWHEAGGGAGGSGKTGLGDFIQHPSTKGTILDPARRAEVRASEPIAYGAGASLGRTIRQVPDTAIGTFEPGVGFGKTDLGRQIKTEGVLPTVLAKAADVATLAGGVGMLGEALGGGRLAELGKLNQVADASIKALHTGEKVETAEQAARLATDAARVGDTSRAANLDAITKTLARKEALEALGEGTKLEKATAAAKTVSHFGGKVAGAPAEVWVKAVKGLGSAVKAIPGVEEAVARVATAARESKLAAARRASKLVRESSSEHLTGEQARLNGGIVSGTKAAIKATGGDATAEAAAILRHTGSADALAKLADLPDEQLAPLLEQHVGPGFTPDALRLALAPTPEVEAAARAFDDRVVAPHEARFVNQYGNKGTLSEAGLANRAAGVEHPLEPLPIALEKETAKRTSTADRRISAVDEEARAIQQRNLEARAGTLSPGAERAVAADKATVRSIERNVRREEQRSASLSKSTERATAGVEERAANRTGKIIGEGRAKIEEAGQLDTKLKGRQARAVASARRAEATAAQGEKFRAPKLNEPGTEAVWSNADHNVPVTVERSLGVGPDGREYVKVHGSNTGVPVDELKPNNHQPTVLRQDSTRGVAAAEARAAADEIKGVRSPNTVAQVQRDLNAKARVENARSGAEASTTEKLTAGETRRQESALSRAKTQAETTKIAATERADRLQNEANRRLVKQDENRLATLDERKADLHTKRAAMVKEVAESTKVAPKPARAILIQSKGIADELRTLAEKHGDPSLAALADALPTKLEHLANAGVEPKYAFGGVDEAKGGSRKTASAEVSRKALASEREATTGLMSSSFKGQAEKALSESRGMARNEFGPKIAKQIAHETGIARAADVFKEHPELRGLKGEELAAGLKDAGYRPWDPNGTGRLISKSKLDSVHAGTPVLPEAFAGKVDQLLKVPEGEPLSYAQMVKSGALKALDRVTAGARIAKLLEPGWQLKKTLGDPVMLAVMGVNPLEAAMHFPEAFKAVREGNLTPGLGASAEGQLAMEAPRTALGRASRSVTNKMFAPFGKADSLAREIAYRSKLADGLSPSAAAAEVKRGLGDLQHMTSAEKNVLKRTFTFYPWQKHVAQTLIRLPLEHPAGLAQAAHLQQIADKNPEETTAEKLTNPFESSVLSMIGGNVDRGTAALGSQVNPAVRGLVGGLTGISLSRGGSPISTPGQKPLSGPQFLFALRNPVEYAKYLAEMSPTTRTAQDLLNTAPARGGKLPQRYETGEPVRATKNGKPVGAIKPATLGATNKGQVLKKMVGIDPPAPVLKKAKKK